MILAQDTIKKSFGNDRNYTKYIRFAKVTEVFDTLVPGQEENYGKVSLIWLDSLAPVHGPVSYLKAGYSSAFGYGIIVVPSVGDVAACYSVSGAQPIILGFFSWNQFKNAYASVDNTGDFANIPDLKSGEVLIKGKSQSSISFKNNGNIAISVKNGANITPVVNADQRRTASKFQDRVSCSETNSVLDINLGLTDELAGPGRQVLSCTTGPSTTQIFEFNGQQGVLDYSLGNLSGVDVTGLDYVNIFIIGKDGSRALKKKLDRNSGVKLSKTFYYNMGLDNSTAETNPCTMDTNSVVTTISLPPSIRGLLGNKSTLIQVSLLIKKPKFSLKVNEFGDLLVNCRNAVINAEDGKSQFGVFADSRIVSNAVHAELGNKLTGFISTDRGGVQISTGSYQHAVIENIEPGNLENVTEDTFYFYVSDSFPLICYTASDSVNPFHLVTAVEYKGLDAFEKSRIMCKPFDFTHGITVTDGFSREKMESLLKEAQEKGETVLSYSDLKML